MRLPASKQYRRGDRRSPQNAQYGSPVGRHAKSYADQEPTATCLRGAPDASANASDDSGKRFRSLFPTTSIAIICWGRTTPSVCAYVYLSLFHSPFSFPPFIFFCFFFLDFFLPFIYFLSFLTMLEYFFYSMVTLFSLNFCVLDSCLLFFFSILLSFSYTIFHVKFFKNTNNFFKYTCFLISYWIN